MPTIMICGSRHWSNPAVAAARDYVRRAMERAIEKNYNIAVGDAHGVDEWVCEFAGKYRKVFVYGLTPEPRNGWTGFYNNDRIGADGIRPFLNYSDRDQYLVQLSKHVICVWNGSSNGTAAVNRYAQSINKQTKILDFSKRIRQSA